MELIKENEKGKTYQAEGFKITYRNSGAVSGDNAENLREALYFITGSAEVIIEDKTVLVKSPAQIAIPARTYHKITAITDIASVLFEYED